MCQRWELCERGKEVHETAGDLRGDVCEGEEGEQGVRVEWVIYTSLCINTASHNIKVLLD